MDDWLMIVLIVAGVLLVAGLVYWATTGRNRRIEHKREQAGEVRQEARARAQSAGEKDLEARRLAEQAQEERSAAEELDRKAADLDPDTSRSR